MEEKIQIKKPELLSPVGKMENLYAAIEGGADSVYLGLQKFNARGKAGNFTVSDIYAIKKYLKNLDKRMFLVLNTIIKDEELPELYKYLQIIENLKPDGLIIQDVGLLNLIKTKTKIILKGIELHASTQMSTFNSASIEFFKNEGFKRVVLERHLTLQEISKIKKAVPDMELEVFVHGAMCYTLSGSCYFSSYLGGLSANRGLCAQVCRRNFKFDNDSKKGYLFSLSDMETVKILDKIIKTGVEALKIEGRMKSPDYVYTVTKAYRHLIDNINDFDNALKEAQDILQGVVSRRKSFGFYLSSAPKDVTDPFKSGVYGKMIGKVVKQKNKTVTVKLFEELQAKSRIRLHNPKKDTTSTSKVKKVIIKGKPYEKAFINDLIEIELNDDYTYEKNNPLYLISTPPLSKWPDKLKSNVKPKKIKLKEYKSPKNDKKTQHQPIYFTKLSDYSSIRHFSNLKNNYIVLKINDRNLNNLNAYNYKKVFFSFPSVIFENDLNKIKKQVKFLSKQGVTKFEITSLSNLTLLKDIKTTEIISSHQIDVINREAVNFLSSKNIKATVLSVEITKNELKSIKDTKKINNIIVPIYGKIRLFVSRAPHEELKKQDEVKSLRDEKFIFKREEGLSLTLSDKDFSLTKKLRELTEMGYYKFYIDLEYKKVDKKFSQKLIQSIKSSKVTPNTNTFNYFLKLK
jgi:putative protease